jgi:hypothetical protein
VEAEPGTFEAFYASAVQHPLLLWAAALAALARVCALPGLDPALRRYCLALGLLSLSDAWLTAGHVFGLGQLSGAAASAVPLLFVLAGDFRYLLLVTAATPDARLRPRSATVASAAALTLIVPILSQAATALLPASLDTPRMLYWIYEVAFLGLTLALLRWHPGLRGSPWLRSLSRFVMLYYGLWAAADSVLLLSGADWGYALRVLPNVLYYGGFIAAVGELAARRGA